LAFLTLFAYICIMKYQSLALFLLFAGIAQARQDPTPKPSGIVVHLFSPSPGTASPPSTGGILRQMFVTGDPSKKPGAALPKGKAASN
jgi:hypothetical protein